MSDTALRDLQEDLEQLVRPPAFADIRARRVRRNRRNRSALGVLAAVAVAVTIGATTLVPKSAPAPTAHGPSAYFGSISGSNDGNRFFMLRGSCSKKCARVSQLRLYSATLSTGWRAQGSELPGGQSVAAQSVGPLVATGPHDFFYAIGGTIYQSSDGGDSWRAYPVDSDPAVPPGPAASSQTTAGVTAALLTVNDRLYLVRPGTAPVHEALPSGASGVVALSAFDYSSAGFFAYVVTTVNGAPRVFRAAAGTWTDDELAPCIAGDDVAVGAINVAATEDGYPPQAVVCTNDDRSIYRLSTDGGRTWTAPMVMPAAEAWTVWLTNPTPGRSLPGWIANDRGRVYRTVDGIHLVDSSPPGIAGHATSAYGFNTGLIVVDRTAGRVYVTGSTGDSWILMT
jgi:photosystem II stability/assembly factor-like uncharacterized protein